MNTTDHIKMMVAAARGVDPHAQLMTNVQMAAMLDAALGLHLGAVLTRLDELKSLMTSKAQESQAAQVPETPGHVEKAPCKYGERLMLIKELVPIFSLSHTSFVRLIQAGVLPYDRTPRGTYLLNAEEVWEVFQARFRVPGRVASGVMRRVPNLERLERVHKDNRGRLLWNTVDLAGALGVDGSTVHFWRRSGLACFMFEVEAGVGGRVFRYDLQDVIYFFAKTTKELAEQKGGEV